MSLADSKHIQVFFLNSIQPIQSTARPFTSQPCSSIRLLAKIPSRYVPTDFARRVQGSTFVVAEMGNSKSSSKNKSNKDHVLSSVTSSTHLTSTPNLVETTARKRSERRPKSEIHASRGGSLLFSSTAIEFSVLDETSSKCGESSDIVFVVNDVEEPDSSQLTNVIAWPVASTKA